MGRAPCCDKANIKKGPWSPEEDLKLREYIDQHGTGGNWISLPLRAGLRRCGKSCRLRWLNYLRPNIKHGEFSDHEDRIICTLYANIGSRWSIIAAQLPGRTDNDIKNYWNTKLKKKLSAANIAPLALSSLSFSYSTKPRHHHYLQYPSPAPALSTGAYYFTAPAAGLVRPAFTTTTSDIDLNNASDDQIFRHAETCVAATLNLQNYPQLNNSKDHNSFLTFGDVTDATCGSSDGSSNMKMNNMHIISSNAQPEFHDYMLNSGSAEDNKFMILDDSTGYDHHASLGYYYDSIEEFKQLLGSTTSTLANVNGDICLLDESKTARPEGVMYF